ncbi:DinB family protein [Brevibacillus migulae]|uniref:DinB family protein n=1 Tax=Brevibacillus migulae TaxID=1644114 RepID=UPI00106EE353|nr:DinB family protein [Brevibacillus migulae]
MLQLFRYNWLVREEWFEWCKHIPIEELLRSRTGGAGSILLTLFHIADVEYSWIRGIQGKPDILVPFENDWTLTQVKALSDSWINETKLFLNTWSHDWDNEPVTVSWNDGCYTQGEILRHVIAHEIHHVGQLSVWAREMGLTPVSANVIGRGLFPNRMSS